MRAHGSNLFLLEKKRKNSHGRSIMTAAPAAQKCPYLTLW